ncbi:MAG: T9SS type A sorting domain-containing protein [Saprospiraceae bacterium]|nr:T9SS type A sorting domain-containing protein [Saprospiraceae bacterium]
MPKPRKVSMLMKKHSTCIKLLPGLLGIIFFLLGASTIVKAQTTDCVFFEMPLVAGSPGETVEIPFRVQDFEDIISMSLGLQWSAQALQFNELQFHSNPLGLSNANFNPNQPGTILFTWFDPNAIGVDLPDSTVLFSIRLFVLNPAPGWYPIALKDALYLPAVVKEPGGGVSVSCRTGGVQIGSPAVGPLTLGNFCVTNSTNCASATGKVTYNLTNGTAPLTYNWTGPAGFMATTQGLLNVSHGFYYLNATDATGLQIAVVVYIFSEIYPLNITSQSTPTSCNEADGCIYLDLQAGTQPVSYVWSDNNLSGPEICELPPGIYSVTATDANGCLDVDSIQVQAANQLVVQASATPANCAADIAGGASAAPQNGTAPYTFAWSNQATGALITNLVAGLYRVTATDAIGCTGIAQTLVSDAGSSTWGLSLDPICLGGSAPSGNLLLGAINPAAIDFPLLLSWSNGSISEVLQPANDTIDLMQMAPQGAYSVTALDAAGCSDFLNTALECIWQEPGDSAALVWPGDLDNNNAVNHHDLLSLALALGVTGPTRTNASLDWAGQPANDWAASLPGSVVNLKNLDANGDGQVNLTDTMGIVANWGRVVHPLSDNPFAEPTTVPGMAPGLALYLEADTLLPGQIATIPLALGSELNPVADLHGLSFSISYDPDLLHPLYFEPQSSWLGDPSTELLCMQRHFPGQHRLDVVLSRTDGAGAGGFGLIGHTFIIIEDDIFFKGKQGFSPDGGGGEMLETPAYTTNIQAITPENIALNIAGQRTGLLITKTVQTNTPIEEESSIWIAPNPASTDVRLQSAAHAITSVCFFNALGNIVSCWGGEPDTEISVPVSHLPPGTYFVRANTEETTILLKFIRQ